MREEEIRRYIRARLEWDDFQDILEEFDLTAEEIFVELFFRGMIDEDLIR